MSEIELDAYAWSGLEYLESVSGFGAIAEMVGDFAKDAPGRLVRMRAALAAGEWQSLSRLAHDLKSNSATLGVLQLSTLAARIEQKALDGPDGDLAPLIEAVGLLLPRVLITLEERARHYSVNPS
jgi:HPt (histidine-containing phosphotransfer) domain-containing protein